MGHRRRAREIALQVLFQIDMTGIDPHEALDLFWSHFDAPENAREFAAMLILGTTEHLEAIDTAIRDCSDHWSLERMARVDKNILRMAVFELLYLEEIPPKATLNEAIDLGKTFGSENSGSFVNGILDAFYSRMQTGHED
ncbi:MAG TPA: transcription antitermination factor NusB [Deltaproteobacteria bacterium]|nr:transcription antitermination factor NusB [Deltaproteobacteria bacterium]